MLGYERLTTSVQGCPSAHVRRRPSVHPDLLDQLKEGRQDGTDTGRRSLMKDNVLPSASLISTHPAPCQIREYAVEGICMCESG